MADRQRGGVARFSARHASIVQVRQAFPALTNLIGDDRDRMLVRTLVSILSRPRRAEWLTVFEFG